MKSDQDQFQTRIFRAIDVNAEGLLPPLGQSAPVLQWVSVADLVIDDSYQRELTVHSWRSIRRIAEAFDWAHFGAILVAPVEGGRFAIIDGQHRAHAAAMRGLSSVPAVISLRTVSAQARAFAMVNSTTVKVTPLQVYKAALASGEEWAVTCRAAAEAAGCRIRFGKASTEHKRAGDIQSVTVIRETVAKVGPEVVTKALKALMGHAEAAMGPASGSLLFRDDVLRPWLWVLAEHPQYLRLDLDAFLRRNRLMNLLEGARRLRDSEPHVPVVMLQRHALILRFNEFMADGGGA